MCHRWRAAICGDAFPLVGEIEAGGTYVGGKDENSHWAKKGRQQCANSTGFG